MRIASAIVFAIVAALFAFWWGWVRAPAPAAVCEHVIALMQAEAGAQGIDPGTSARLLESTHEQCLTRSHDKLALRGRMGYARWAKCMAHATTVAETGRC